MDPPPEPPITPTEGSIVTEPPVFPVLEPLLE